MRLLITGDRNWVDADLIRKVIEKLKPSVIIQGGCRGADAMAREVGNQLGIPILEYPANWNKHGRAAGPIRNRQMIKEGNPTNVMAFHDDIKNSRGTADMVAAAVIAHITTELISHEKITIYYPPLKQGFFQNEGTVKRSEERAAGAPPGQPSDDNH